MGNTQNTKNESYSEKDLRILDISIISVLKNGI
jgi:hypothetical protein